MSRLTSIAGLVLVLVAGGAVAQGAPSSFDELLAAVRSDAAARSAENTEREQRFLDSRNEQQTMLDEVRAEVSLLTHPSYNRLPHGFAHIFAGGYAAGYYSYKWAEVLAADAFAAFEEAGIFDAGTAARFRREILEIGGSRDFMQAYVDFRGRRPEIDALLRQSGIVAP